MDAADMQQSVVTLISEAGGSEVCVCAYIYIYIHT